MIYVCVFDTPVSASSPTPGSTASHATSSQPWNTTANPMYRTDGARRRNPSSASMMNAGQGDQVVVFGIPGQRNDLAGVGNQICDGCDRLDV